MELLERLLDGGDLKLQKAMLWNVFISNTSMMEWSLFDSPNTSLFIEYELHLALFPMTMKGFRMHAKFLRCKNGLRIFFCLPLEGFIKSSILKISKLKGSSNDQKAVQITNPSYATR